MFLKNCWYMAGWSRDFADAVVGKTIVGEPVAFFRTSSGELRALEDRCAHRLAPLSLGRVQGDDLQCLYHGVRFAGDGTCTHIPGQTSIPKQACVRAYPVVERHSAAWIWMGDAALADQAQVPEFVGVDHPDWAMTPGQMEYDAHYTLIHDNLLDLSHIAYVHRNSFAAGDPAAAERWENAAPEIGRIEGGLKVDRWIENATLVPYATDALGQTKGNIWSSYTFTVPGIFILCTKSYPVGTPRGADGGEPQAEPVHVSFTCQAVTPVDERKTVYYFAFGPWARHGEMQDFYHGVGQMAFAEDKVMLEAQQAVIDRSPEHNLRSFGMDKAPNLYRAMMARLIEAEAA